MLPPRPLLALCLLLMGLLAWSVSARPAPDVPLGAIAPWEGQEVRTEGVATQVHADAAGLRFSLLDAGHALSVHGPSVPAPPQDGSPVRVTGRVTRWQGALRLELDDAEALQALGPGGAWTS